MAEADDERLHAPDATGRIERPHGAYDRHRGTTPDHGAGVVTGNVERVVAKVKGLLRSED